MKINKAEEGYYLLTPENNETLKNIAISVIIASYELAIPYGYGFSRPHRTELTKEMAERMLNGEDVSKDYAMNRNKKNEVDMDYVFGRCCKTYIRILEETNQVEVAISKRDRNPEKVLKEASMKLLLKGIK